MFTFDATPVKYVGLLVLFGWSVLWCSYELTRKQDHRQRVANALHLVMAVVMLAMVPGWAWRWLTAVVPTWGWTAVFAAATCWFVWAAATTRRGDRGATLHFAGHAGMFGAMTWHLAAMAVMSAGMASVGVDGHDHSAHGDGHGAGGHDWMTHAAQSGGALWVLALVGVPFMGYLLVASITALWKLLRPHTRHADAAVTGHAPEAGTSSARGAHGTVAVLQEAAVSHSCREPRPVGSPRYRLEALTDLAMNFGMFWMSTGLLVPILPWFAALSF